nr:glycosyltransferase family protein [Butyrivibrio sp.]
MLVWDALLDSSQYQDSNGNFTEEGKAKLLREVDEEYREFDTKKEAIWHNHKVVSGLIDGLLSNNDPNMYYKIEKIIKTSEYHNLAKLFYDFHVFTTSYAIYQIEKESGLSCNIYSVVDSIKEYEQLRLSIQYLYRKIQMNCENEDIDTGFEELINRGISIFCMIQLLRELRIGDRGYIGSKLSELYAHKGKNSEATIMKNFAETNFKDKECSYLQPSDVGQQTGAEHKICFVTCVNDEYSYNECLYYLNRLMVPSGCQIESLAIREADSMTSGYNAAADSTDADIIIYMHQDVCILNPYFIYEVIRIFENDEAVGLIGLVGTPRLAPDAVMWHDRRIGNLFATDDKVTYKYPDAAKKPQYSQVEAVDGFMIITNKKVKWREDLFDGWDFYDVSQCAEYRKRGYKVVVPEQDNPWVAHDDGFTNQYNYDKYRKRYIEEYM